MTDIKIHLNPLSRDRADFLIHAKCGKAGEDTFWEQLWVKQLTDNQFEICCIPFFARDIAIGDVVETHSDGQFQHLIKRVIQPSGHYTFRIWFGESKSNTMRDEVVQATSHFGGLYEWYSRNLLGVSVLSEEIARKISSYLLEREGGGLLSYETGRTL